MYLALAAPLTTSQRLEVARHMAKPQFNRGLTNKAIAPKFCTKCGTEKPRTEFNIGRAECRECGRVYGAKYRASVRGKATRHAYQLSSSTRRKVGSSSRNCYRTAGSGGAPSAR